MENWNCHSNCITDLPHHAVDHHTILGYVRVGIVLSQMLFPYNFSMKRIIFHYGIWPVGYFNNVAFHKYIVCVFKLSCVVHIHWTVFQSDSPNDHRMSLVLGLYNAEFA
jgi:hypothetical protein